MLVEDIAMQCPVIDNFDPIQELKDKEIKYLKEELEDIDWISISIDTIKELELKGDCFYQIYFPCTFLKGYPYTFFLHKKYL